jgi:hypothetical protein
MSGYQIVTGGHLDDGLLLQLIDQEPGMPADARAHLGACDECASRLSKLRGAGAMLRAALPDIAMPDIALARPKLRRAAWLMPVPLAAAATLVVLASAAAAAPPVRAWIMRHLTAEPPIAPATAPPSPAPEPATRSPGIIASFAPTDTALIIRFDRRQARGTLELTVAGADRISAQAIDGASAEELFVLPGELRVANATTSLASYRVTVPTSVRVIRVLIGTTEAATLRVTSGLERRIDLR